MAQLIVSGSGSTLQRPVLYRGDMPRRDDATIRIPVEGVPAGRTLKDAWLTAKTLKSDLDAAALFKLKITSVLNADGQITDIGADGVGSLDFLLTPARLALLTTWKHYDAQVGLDNGDTHTIEVGQMRSVVASINPFSGRRSTALVVRSVWGEPIPGHIGEVPNELINDVVAGDNYEVIRTIKGLPFPATAARLNVRVNASDGDPPPGPGFQLAISIDVGPMGQITGAGDATQVRFIFTRAQTAVLTTPRAFDIQMTAGGKVYTAALGTIWAPDDVTDEEGAPGAALLFKYVAGDSLSGLTLVRATSARYYDAAGVVQTAASGVARDAHYLGGVRHLLFEPLRTNIALESEALDNAWWTKAGLTVTPDATTAPNGAATADKLVESALNEGRALFRSSIATDPNQPQAFSCFVKAAGRSWVRIRSSNLAPTTRDSWFNVTTGLPGISNAGHTLRSVALGSGWYRLSVTVNSEGSAPGVMTWGVAPADADGAVAYQGDGVSGLFVWGMQLEQNAAEATMYIATTASPVTRNADVPYFAYTPGPQAATLYADATVIHDRVGAGTQPTYVIIGSALVGDNGTQSLGEASAEAVARRRATGGTQIESMVTDVRAFGDRLELRGRSAADGNVLGSYAVNGGAQTDGAASGALAYDASFALSRLYVGDSLYPVAIRSIKVAVGDKSIAEMRVV